MPFTAVAPQDPCYVYKKVMTAQNTCKTGNPIEKAQADCASRDFKTEVQNAQINLGTKPCNLTGGKRKSSKKASKKVSKKSSKKAMKGGKKSSKKVASKKTSKKGSKRH